MTTQWVKAIYNGKRADIIKGHADAGIGYFIIEDGGRGANYWVEAAFLRACDSPVPEHITICDNYESDKLEKRRLARLGIR